MKLKWIVCLALLVITGCSNKPATAEKSTEPTATTKAKASKPKSKPKLILDTFKESSKKQLQYYALGDSLSVGLFSNSQTTRFSTLFTKSLTDKIGKPVVESNTSSVGKTVTNFGVLHIQDLIAKQPDIVTVEFGTNDAAYGVDPTNVNNFVTNLNTVVSELKKKTKAKSF